MLFKLVLAGGCTLCVLEETCRTGYALLTVVRQEGTFLSVLFVNNITLKELIKVNLLNLIVNFNLFIYI